MIRPRTTIDRFIAGFSVIGATVALLVLLVLLATWAMG
jgi:hypothetical protein